MKKRKVIVKDFPEEVLYDNRILITKGNNDNYIFETSNLVTNDIVEGVIMCILMEKENSSVWDLEITNNHHDITPEKSLYWLSGGNKEWNTLVHYTKPWCDCFHLFSDEFGIIVKNIVEESRSFRELKNKIINELNLSFIYEFALSKGLIK